MTGVQLRNAVVVGGGSWLVFLLNIFLSSCYQLVMVLASIVADVGPQPTPWQFVRKYWADFWGGYWEALDAEPGLKESPDHRIAFKLIPRRPTPYEWLKEG